jgi:large subunit ribosomal protein L18
MDKNIDKARKLKKRKLHIRKSISGTASRPRMTVFRSSHHMYVQVIDDVAGKTLISANTVEAELTGLKNTVADATKLGEVIGKRMIEKNITTCVFDRNGYLYHGIVKSIADGARSAGVKF